MCVNLVLSVLASLLLAVGGSSASDSTLLLQNEARAQPLRKWRHGRPYRPNNRGACSERDWCKDISIQDCNLRHTRQEMVSQCPCTCVAAQKAGRHHGRRNGGRAEEDDNNFQGVAPFSEPQGQTRQDYFGDRAPPAFQAQGQHQDQFAGAEGIGEPQIDVPLHSELSVKTADQPKNGILIKQAGNDTQSPPDAGALAALPASEMLAEPSDSEKIADEGILVLGKREKKSRANNPAVLLAQSAGPEKPARTMKQEEAVIAKLQKQKSALAKKVSAKETAARAKKEKEELAKQKKTDQARNRAAAKAKAAESSGYDWIKESGGASAADDKETVDTTKADAKQPDAIQQALAAKAESSNPVSNMWDELAGIDPAIAQRLASNKKHAK